MPIQAQGPDGQLFEFPDGTAEAVMSSAIRKYYAESSPQLGPPLVKRVRFPDGTVRRIEAPAGASDAEILAFAQSQYEAQGSGQRAGQEEGPWTQYQRGGSKFGGVPIDGGSKFGGIPVDPREELIALRRMAELEDKAGGGDGPRKLSEVTGTPKLSEVMARSAQSQSYEVTAPDGRVYEVTAPTGATQDEVLAYAQGQLSNGVTREPPDPSQVRWDTPDPSQVQWDDKPDFSNVSGGSRSSERAGRANFKGVRGGIQSTETARTNPSLFRNDSDFRKRAGVGVGDMLWASAKDMFGTREGAADYLAKEAGGRVGKDADGSPIVELPDGTSYRMNDAGADSTDLANVAGNIAAAWLPASWATRLGKARNMGVTGRIAAQGAAGAGTESALMALFNSGNVDPVRVGVAGVGGGGGELVGTGLNSIVNRGNSSLRNMLGLTANDAATFLNQHGVTAAPDVLARTTANFGQVKAGADPNALLGQSKYGFTYSLGQREMVPAQKFRQLSKEESLRQTPGGFAAFDAMGRNNANKLDDALTGFGERFGARTAATPAEMVQGSSMALSEQAAALNQRITQAYAQAGKGGRTAVGAGAVAALPNRLRQAVGDFDIHPSVTPVADRTLAQIQLATSETLKAVNGGNIKGVTLRALETQRRILNNNIDAATSKTDRAAMVKIKREFDGWLDEAVEGALVSGDKAALDSLRDARALRAEYFRRFEGGKEADKFIAGVLDGSRTPEELLNIALGASQVSKAGGARFIERLRVAASNDPQVMGGLRSAHFSRLTRGNDGKPLPMAAIVRNVNQTHYNNASVVRALYSPEEWKEVRLLAAVLEPMIAKGDFAKSSGSAERLMRMMALKLGGGFIGDAFNAATSGLKGVQAQRAINAPVRPPSQSLPGFVPTTNAVLGEYGNR